MQAERIVAVKSFGKIRTLDLEVNTKKHLYYQDGLIGSNSHAIGYSEISYWTAWCKVHLPIHFYCAWLELSNEKIDPKEEVSELVEDAKVFGVGIYPPLLTNENFSISKTGVHFGLKNVKGLGQSSIAKLLNRIIESQKFLGKDIKDWTWFELLLFLSENISKTVFNNLISIGVISISGMTRQKMLHEYMSWNLLTPREKKLIAENCSDLLDGVCYINDNQLVSEKRRAIVFGIIQTLKNPPYETEDSPKWITDIEEELLGTAITCNKVDNINTSMADTTCKEFIDGKSQKEMVFGVEISRATNYIMKNGKKAGDSMGFLTLKDNSGSIDAVVFSDLWSKIKNVVYRGNTCLITGYRSDKGGLVVKGVREI